MHLRLITTWKETKIALSKMPYTKPKYASSKFISIKSNMCGEELCSLHWRQQLQINYTLVGLWDIINNKNTEQNTYLYNENKYFSLQWITTKGSLAILKNRTILVQILIKIYSYVQNLILFSNLELNLVYLFEQILILFVFMCTFCSTVTADAFQLNTHCIVSAEYLYSVWPLQINRNAVTLFKCIIFYFHFLIIQFIL